MLPQPLPQRWWWWWWQFRWVVFVENSFFFNTVLNGRMQSARKRNDRLFEKLITPPPSTPCALRVRESEKNVLQSRIQTKPVCYFQIADKQRSERESLLSVFHSCYTLSLRACECVYACLCSEFLQLNSKLSDMKLTMPLACECVHVERNARMLFLYNASVVFCSRIAMLHGRLVGWSFAPFAPLLLSLSLSRCVLLLWLAKEIVSVLGKMFHAQWVGWCACTQNQWW